MLDLRYLLRVRGNLIRMWGSIPYPPWSVLYERASKTKTRAKKSEEIRRRHAGAGAPLTLGCTNPGSNTEAQAEAVIKFSIGRKALEFNIMQVRRAQWRCRVGGRMMPSRGTQSGTVVAGGVAGVKGVAEHRTAVGGRGGVLGLLVLPSRPPCDVHIPFLMAALRASAYG